ncbi:MAG: hypothetical protein AAF639_22780 [Chloroflexota bacterium]
MNINNNKLFISGRQIVVRGFLALSVVVCLSVAAYSIPELIASPSTVLIEGPALVWEPHNGFGG